jgi:hypothetical protein
MLGNVMTIRILAGLLLALGAAGAGAGEAYRWVDEDGTVVYSDRPAPGATRVPLPGVQTVPGQPLPGAAASAAATPPPAAAAYLNLGFVSPLDDQSIHDNSGDLPVSLLVEPSLDVERGHRLQLYLDGAPWGEPTEQTSFMVPNVDRGTHFVEVRVLDTQGRVVDESAVVTFHMHRQSALNRRRAN